MLQEDYKRYLFGEFIQEKPVCSRRYRGSNCPEEPVIGIRKNGEFEYFCEKCHFALNMQNQTRAQKKVHTFKKVYGSHGTL